MHGNKPKKSYKHIFITASPCQQISSRLLKLILVQIQCVICWVNVSL